jgi:putative N-acetylmannosamine-6-phosphate epimerase
MVRRRSVQMNPYVYTVKQHCRSKVQDIMIDATKKKSPKKDWSMDEYSRSQSQCMVMES